MINVLIAEFDEAKIHLPNPHKRGEQKIPMLNANDNIIPEYSRQLDGAVNVAAGIVKSRHKEGGAQSSRQAG